MAAPFAMKVTIKINVYIKLLLNPSESEPETNAVYNTKRPNNRACNHKQKFTILNTPNNMCNQRNYRNWNQKKPVAKHMPSISH